MRTIFRFFRGILRMAWSLFWGFFWTIAISFLVLVGIIYFTDSPSSGMDGFGRAAQKVVYQVGNLFGDQGFSSRFGMAPSSQTTQTDNHEHSGARWEKAEATVYLDPNISQTFVKAYRDAIEAWNQTGAFSIKLVNFTLDFTRFALTAVTFCGLVAALITLEYFPVTVFLPLFLYARTLY